MADSKDLLKIKERLEAQLRSTQVELEAINKVLRLLEREGAASGQSSKTRRFARRGLANSCREIVTSDWIAPLEVRDRLMAGGYPAKSKSKLLGGVYATLRRLADSGELERGKQNGKMAFRRKQKTPAESNSGAMEEVRAIA